MKKMLSMTFALLISVTGLMISARNASAQACENDPDCPTNACTIEARCTPFQGMSLTHVSERGFEKAGSCKIKQRKNCCVTDNDCISGQTCVKESQSKKSITTGKCRELKNAGAVKNVNKTPPTPAGKTSPQGKKIVTTLPVEEPANLKAVSEKMDEILDSGDVAMVAKKTIDAQTGEPVFNLSLVQEIGSEEIQQLEIGKASVADIEKISLSEPKITFNILSSPEDTTTASLEPNSFVASPDLVVSKIADSSLQLSTVQKILEAFATEKTSAPTESEEE